MAKKFKDYYDDETVRFIADKISYVFIGFDSNSFSSYVAKNIVNKEFLERQDVFSNAFEKFLGDNYVKNISLFTKILGPELKTETGMFSQGYWLWPIGRYVERHGTKNFTVSSNFIHSLTKRFTGEYAIRPLLVKFPKETMKIMLAWSKDENVHVRRLASEGLRINLPWSKKNTVCLDEFTTYKKILSNLKGDTSKFVQKSVGNNLNDLYKSYPEKAIEIINVWQQENPGKETLWIINHGMRSIKKKIKKEKNFLDQSIQ